MTPRPFVPQLPSGVLEDLATRLAGARWPDIVAGSGWEYGTERSFLRDLVAYWRAGFHWDRAFGALGAGPHFRATVRGVDLHFRHLRGKGPDPLPLVLTHGWPGSFLEMHKVAPMLADPTAYGGDPRDAFDVVVPALPGYAFSDRPRRGGWSRPAIADLWHPLMTEVLGYRRYGAHGGDIGASVTSHLGLRHPDALVGIHVSALLQPHLGPGTPPLSTAERQYCELVARWGEEEGAYAHQQRTRPLTLAYGLQDSPVGLLAWLVEKYRAWSDCGGDVLRRFTRDELLATATLYWATETVHSSLRLYFDSAREPSPLGPGDRIRVPTGVCLTVEPVDRAPREWAERSYAVQRFTALPRGGHFLAMEEPGLLVEDLRAFFRPLRR